VGLVAADYQPVLSQLEGGHLVSLEEVRLAFDFCSVNRFLWHLYATSSVFSGISISRV
jgi:hypothetical protein